MTNLTDWQVALPSAIALLIVLSSIALASRKHGPTVPIALVVWMTLTFELADHGVFLRFDALPPRVLVAAMTAIASSIAFARSAAGRSFLGDIPLAAIAAAQVFRLPVELALHALFVRGAVPVQMTWEGRNVDIAVGLTAPLIAWAFHTRRVGARGLALWHLASLAALVNIVATSAMSFPGPMRRFVETAPVTVVATAPFIWLPTVLVPFAAVSHLVSLRALARKD